jgi:hypothetical protein
MTKPFKRKLLTGQVLIAGVVALSITAAAEETSTDDSATVYEPVDGEIVHAESIGRSTNVESKLSSEFSEFLGGEERAAEVVSGLRTGEEFHITELEDGKLEPPPSGSTMETPPPQDPSDPVFTIDPPTDTMGYGNVRLTMRLTQANLETLGITHPTNEQLSAMLVGGEIDGVHYEGILNERAAGAGWGEIAQRYDFKVGQLMGNAPSAKSVAPVEPPPETQTTQGNGYIPGGAGGSAYVASGRHRAKNEIRTNGKKANGYIPSGPPARSANGIHGVKGGAVAKSNPGKANGYIASGKPNHHGASVQSTYGASSGHVTKAGNGHAKGLSKGYVASGSSPGAGIVSAGNLSTAATVGAAKGQGHAKGHTKQHGKNK